MIDIEKLLSVKGLAKSKFPSVEFEVGFEVGFEVVWARCIKSIADVFKNLRKDHTTIKIIMISSKYHVLIIVANLNIDSVKITFIII